MPHGQIVLGPPGSGKTTYCRGVSQFSRLTGRPCFVLNLDPGAERAPNVFGEEEHSLAYDVAADCCSVANVMKEFKLGPNGALLYCMDYILENLAEHIIPGIKKGILASHNGLQADLAAKAGKGAPKPSTWEELQDVYVVLDFPGQVELYTHSTVTRSIIELLTIPAHKGGALALQLACVNVVDSLSCLTPNTYLSTILVSLQSMINIQLPCVNVMSKMDLLKPHIDNGELDLPLDFYLDARDLDYLLQFMGGGGGGGGARGGSRRERLASSIAELVEDFSMLRYRPLDVCDGDSLAAVIQDVDDASGYVFRGEAGDGVEKMVRTVREAEGRELVEKFMGGAFAESISELDT